MMRSVVALVLLGFSLATAAACSDGGSKPSATPTLGGTIVVPHSILDELTNYAFSSDLQISLPDHDMSYGFDGVFVAPDRYQGTFRMEGLVLGERPAESETVAIGLRTWWRNEEGAWQGPVISTDMGFDPFLIFSNYASPEFFITGLTFDTLELQTVGIDDVNGSAAHHVHFTKSELVALLDEGTFTEQAGLPAATVREDTLAFLPEDTIIDAWLDKDTLTPVRIVVTLSDDDQTRNFEDLLAENYSVRLQMDITDPDAGAEVEPPLASTPVPSSTP